MITKPVDITLTNPQITALLNADEAGGRIVAQVSVLRALHIRRLATSPAAPSYLTDDGREVVRQCIGHGGRRTFTLLRPSGGR
jgi:hypothetical protein